MPFLPAVESAIFILDQCTFRTTLNRHRDDAILVKPCTIVLVYLVLATSCRPGLDLQDSFTHREVECKTAGDCSPTGRVGVYPQTTPSQPKSWVGSGGYRPTRYHHATSGTSTMRHILTHAPAMLMHLVAHILRKMNRDMHIRRYWTRPPSCKKVLQQADHDLQARI